MNSYQKLKQRVTLLETVVKRNEEELEYLSQNVDLTQNSKVGSILHPYMLRSSLKKQIEKVLWSGDAIKVNVNIDDFGMKYFEVDGLFNIIDKDEM